MEPILITGVNGFLGSHLTDFCIKQGKTVYGIDLPNPSLHNLSQYTNVKLISLSHRYKMTNDNNYLLMKARKPYQFVWNNYKTSDAYGRIVVDIPDELADIILKYFNSNS